jgi:hypothetical protein
MKDRDETHPITTEGDKRVKSEENRARGNSFWKEPMNNKLK